jgi:hypothetical protein
MSSLKSLSLFFLLLLTEHQVIAIELLGDFGKLLVEPLIVFLELFIDRLKLIDLMLHLLLLLFQDLKFLCWIVAN